MYEPEFLREAQRQLAVCNACRYCEGFCAVFPALELRREVESGDLTYLANLCHDCRDCYTACMFVPPHEFAINIPRVFAAARVRTYEHYSRPAALSSLVRRSLGGTAAVALAGIAAVWLAVLAFLGPATLASAHRGPGAFYAVAPYLAIVVPAIALALYGVGVVLSGARRFTRDIRGPGSAVPPLATIWRAVGDAVALRYLGGGGVGCYYPRRRGSSIRRWLHHAVAGGFLAALVSTTLAAIFQDLLGVLPPFPVLSAPVLFGIAGGILLIVGTTGLIVLRAQSDPAPGARMMTAMDYAFLALLDAVAVTGMLLLLLRDTTAMGWLLVVHLGLVAALFVTAPYGKFVHFVYRFLALVQHAAEQRAEAVN